MNEFKKRPVTGGPTPSERREELLKQQQEQNSSPIPSRRSSLLLSFLQHHYVWSAIIVLIFVAMGKAVWNVATLANELSIKEVFLSVFSEKVLMDEGILSARSIWK